ncbi:universal stress protein [Nocardioides donggukensis]|uniref:Universal stress protein n=1 Tax=Nocardioides donggukensis TaxID=2774019 RepID=A0A927K5A6_9ACTN|nr:universal stress protein [Nocardioides donggukensis]MBD8870171.1 universal stress protein [Nocardioides donggukensis]
MSTRIRTRHSVVDWTAPGLAVVVAVDGSEQNRAAIGYAVAEATRSGRPLRLLAVIDDYAFPVPRHGTGGDDELQWQVLNGIHARLHEQHPELDLARDVRVGPAATTLLEHSEDQAELVVGKRGLGTFGRLLIGSTSIAVAGRSRVPVVVVPDSWQEDRAADTPVVVGVRAEDPEPAVLRFALAQARARRAPLLVVHAIHIDPILVWDPSLSGPAYRMRAERGAGQVEAALAPLREEFPDVTVGAVESEGHPADVLLDRAAAAQLLVLGRQHEGRAGFTLGSVARAVLHHSEIPVAVVPSP